MNNINWGLILKRNQSNIVMNISHMALLTYANAANQTVLPRGRWKYVTRIYGLKSRLNSQINKSHSLSKAEHQNNSFIYKSYIVNKQLLHQYH